MAKKFGKFLLFVSMIGAAVAGAFYFIKNKESSPAEEDDYEDLDDDSDQDDDMASSERSYVSLNADKEGTYDSDDSKKNASGTTVEEFFDDDDSDGSLDAI